MKGCVFCQIGLEKVEAEILLIDTYTVCFKDSNPVAPVHLLFIPKIHFISINEINKNNSVIFGEIFENMNKITEKMGLKDYRVVVNNGKDAGQTMEHLHFHLLAGREFGWPPG